MSACTDGPGKVFSVYLKQDLSKQHFIQFLFLKNQIYNISNFNGHFLLKQNEILEAPMSFCSFTLKKESEKFHFLAFS